MRNFLLIARHEYIKYVTRRGFLISLLMFPLWVGLASILPQLVQRTEPQPVFIVVDRDGAFRDQIATVLADSQALQTLRALAEFATANNADFSKIARIAPKVADMLKAPEREASQEAYLAMGGLDPVFEALTPALSPGWSEFTPPKPQFKLIATPGELESAESISNVVPLYFSGERGVGKASKLVAILVIPPNYGHPGSGPAQFWSDNQQNRSLSNLLHALLSEELRKRAAMQAAPGNSAVSEAFAINADIDERDPLIDTRAGNAAQIVERFLPFGFAFLLFMATFISANALLMGVVEEKSTRMIEILLSSASAREIMAGKLLGAVGASLTTIALWVLGLFTAIAMLAPDLAQAILGEAGQLFTVHNLPLLLFYFACGLLIYGALFLGIGSMAASVVDAQALLGPATLILIFPNIMISIILADPNGLFARIISWIPIYTPFFMLMRLPSHPSTVEIWATAALTLATAFFVVLQMTKVFEANVLTTERPPSLGIFLRSLFRRLGRGSS